MSRPDDRATAGRSGVGRGVPLGVEDGRRRPARWGKGRARQGLTRVSVQIDVVRRCQPHIRPGGARGLIRVSTVPPRRGGGSSTVQKNAEEHPQTCSAYGVLVSPTPQSFAPPGRTRTDNVPVFHGFHVGLLGSRAAPPVATIPRPSGARDRSRWGERHPSLGRKTRLVWASTGPVVSRHD